MTKDASSPITDVEADEALACLAAFDDVVLAVSGGPDSMALMVLVAEWKARSPNSRPNVRVATVDHGLREASREEAEHVAAAAGRLGFSHAILTWVGDKPATALAMAARDARYRLLEGHARIAGDVRVAVATAHHQDDQAETFAMRLARGAGVDGLSGMVRERPLSEGSSVALIRPLLAFAKTRLVATLQERGIRFADDPTNRDPRYERARVRFALPALEEAGLSTKALATSARRLNDAREALLYAEEQFVVSLDLSFGNEVFAKLDRDAFEGGPRFLRQKVLSRLIGRYGGASPAPRLSEVEDLVAQMQRGRASAATLGGAVVSCGTRFIRVWREAGRLDQSAIVLEPGQTTIWDQRFVLRLAETCQDNSVRGPVIVKPLGKLGYDAILPRLDPARRPPTRAALALPSFWNGDSLIAAPSLAPFAASCAPLPDAGGCELNPLATAAGF